MLKKPNRLFSQYSRNANLYLGAKLFYFIYIKNSKV